MHWHAFGIQGGLGQINKTCYPSGVYRNMSLTTLKDRLLSWLKEATTGIVFQSPSLHYQFNGEFRRQRGLRFNNSQNDSFFKGHLGIVWLQFISAHLNTANNKRNADVMIFIFSFLMFVWFGWCHLVFIRHKELFFSANLYHIWVLLSWFLHFKYRTELSSFWRDFTLTWSRICTLLEECF